jgi:hypothetical protein
VAAPTTYSGSEMTRVWGITTAGKKMTGRDENVAPKTVLYDPQLLTTLPAHAAVPSAFNAVAHAVKALYAPDRTPITDMYASEGIATLTTAMPMLAKGDMHAAADALCGAWLCGLLPRQRVDGIAPQAWSRSWRHTRSTPRPDTHRGPTARAGIQRSRCARDHDKVASDARHQGSGEPPA